ncbi:hypothetical protein N865_06245 [Intrasporangium oryzae NRRL B-24470]|uniref:Thymidylate kinase n=1 Tax=Intrasporangium oryzae NRRL B-24470 TaxID=1386089 RepID=W9G868_9MICO|nr:hypothetical protein [Intrasporangium oryzae]EWT02406.1 hypothetical protein N865_06245 [Intrasporangium oryzae NRRL B-24470]
MAGLIIVEGLPGSGKSTTAQGLSTWLSGQGVSAEHYPEGRHDNPVDFEQVAVLTNDDLVRFLGELPSSADDLIRAAERSGDVWLVRHGRHPEWPRSLRSRLAEHDSYDGSVSPELHMRVLTESWRQYGQRSAPAHVEVLECVLVQNPVTALLARFDQPVEVVESHIRGLARAAAPRRPALVYLDAGDPRATLEQAAAERSPEWLESVIGYHTQQGYGLAYGLEGFDGYVEFMRHRRSIELEIVSSLDLPTLVVSVDERPWHVRDSEIQAFVGDHLGIDDRAVSGW